MPRAPVIAWLVAGCISAACWRATPPSPPPFAIERASPAEIESGGALLLNDSITVYFSEPIRNASVTANSVTVLDSQGRQIPGALQRDANWVRFRPEPPLGKDLTDGSFRPGETYRLLVVGYPRPDAVCAADGRRLESGRTFELRMAKLGEHGDLPAPLRPPATDLPFFLRTYDVPQKLLVDAPRLSLHFTLPVLPASARPEAFIIQLMRISGPQRLAPRSVTVHSSRLDQYPGSTVEIDLGTEPRRLDGAPDETVVLSVGDFLSVTLADGDDALRDLANHAVLPGLGQPWSVVPGASLALVAWPSADGGIVGDDPLVPGFESQAGVVRPRLRVEAGNGSLGVFRPKQDVVLRPGQPFDRGDGVMVQSHGSVFPFLAIDIGEGIRVRVEGQGSPVHLLACGGIGVDGTLELAGMTVAVPQSRLQHGGAAAELIEQSPLALVAAGDVRIRGAITTATLLPSHQSALTIACAGRIRLLGDLPYNTVLAVESSMSRQHPAIEGARGQTFATSVVFTYGAAAGAGFTVRGCSPWRRLPMDRDGGVLRLFGGGADRGAGVAVSWQAVTADPVRPEAPDLRPDRVPRPRPGSDREWLGVDPGSFVRFLIEAEIAAGRDVPVLHELRLVDR